MQRSYRNPLPGVGSFGTFLSALACIVLVVGLVVGARGAARAADLMRIEGVVLDPELNPIQGATVLLRGTSTRRTKTDHKGAFAFSRLKPGNYEVTARHAGRADSMAYVQLPNVEEGAGREVIVPRGSGREEEPAARTKAREGSAAEPDAPPPVVAGEQPNPARDTTRRLEFRLPLAVSGTRAASPGTKGKPIPDPGRGPDGLKGGD